MELREDKISSLLSRNVEEVIEKDHLEAALRSGKKLRVKFGIDPTSPDLHLGHAVVLNKLKEFQDAGHTIVLIIGDFTARIGDPSGRSETRKTLSEKEIKENMKQYLAHAGKILNIKKAEVAYNNSWFAREGIEQFVQLAMAGTFQQVLRRADFKKRIDADQDITFLELLYPLFQGYDSVKIKANVEVGGTDQKFNLLMGRRVQRHFGMAEQDIMTFPLLEGVDGVKKMSKSFGNYIGLTEPAESMFGKIMSIPDALVEKYFLLCTDISTKEIAVFRKDLGPKELKERLGFEIAKRYHGEKAAREARENFEKIFSKKEIPNDIPELKVKEKMISALDLVVASDVLKSKSEARRLIEQGGFEYDGAAVKDINVTLTIKNGAVLRVGKKYFFRIKN
jgi:tyrosyl-tRNA synthetase